jgi:hypothetical protein
MKKERSYMIESTAWLVATVLMIAVMLSSCGSTHGCHSKGAYVPKSIKKAQAKPYAHN